MLKHLITKAQVMFHDDVIKWKYFPRYWPFVRGIHQPPVNSPHKGPWPGALMFSLICVLRRQSWGWWFETLSRPLWRHCNVKGHPFHPWWFGTSKVDTLTASTSTGALEAVAFTSQKWAWRSSIFNTFWTLVWWRARRTYAMVSDTGVWTIWPKLFEDNFYAFLCKYSGFFIQILELLPWL